MTYAVLDNEARACARLMQAVVIKAVRDACAEDVPYHGHAFDRAKARRWLTEGGPDFREVCSMAGLDGDAIQERALVLAGQGWSMHHVGRVVRGYGVGKRSHSRRPNGKAKRNGL